jgi:ATP-binding cassette subfamily C (CFTR/MRP) protein 1
LGTIVGQQGLSILTNVWLKVRRTELNLCFRANSSLTCTLQNWSQHNNDTHSNGNLAWFLGIYFALGSVTALLFFVNGALLYSLCVVRSARTMHDGMFNSVIRAPMLFFETTPIGQVMFFVA